MRREVAVLGFVKCALQIIDLRPNVDASSKRVAVAILQCGETWQRGKREVYLGNCSRHSIMLQLHGEIRSQVDWIDQFEQSALGIGVRNYGFRRDLLASPEDHADG